MPQTSDNDYRFEAWKIANIHSILCELMPRTSDSYTNNPPHTTRATYGASIYALSLVLISEILIHHASKIDSGKENKIQDNYDLTWTIDASFGI